MGRLIDETGHKFDRLTVIERSGSDTQEKATWLCECECGKQTVVTGVYLRSGHTKSCGCLRREHITKEMTGQKFGRLTVIKRAGSDKWGAAAWLCKCECGNEVVTTGARLRSGNVKSCGCFRDELTGERAKARALPIGEAAFNALVWKIKYSAERRGYIWNLTEDQVKRLTSQPCYYCNAKPLQRGTTGTNHNGSYLYNGLDRVDNTKGYTIDNVVPCCGTCNKAKNTQTIEEFKAWIHAVNEHFVSQFY